MGRKPARATPARKTTYHHGDLRRALLDATLELVEGHGPQGFTLRAAARQAGVTPGAAYHHFADKEALVAAVAEEGFDMLRDALEQAAAAPSASARERSRNVGVAYVMFAVKHPTRFRVMVGFGVQSSLASSAVSTYRLVRDVLVEGLKRTPTEVIADAEVLGWWGVVHGLAFLAIDGHLGPVSAAPARTAAVVRQALLALENRGDAALATPTRAGSSRGRAPKSAS
jgi:AcrR family transcriptional regulator